MLTLTWLFQHFSEARPPTLSAIGERPPETVFPMIALGNNDPNWDMRSDIWYLVCTVSLVIECILTWFLCVFEKIYEILTGSEFFYGVDARGLLGRMARIAGEVPPLWASYWASNEYLKDQGAPVCFFFFFALPWPYYYSVPEISAARASAEWINRRPALVRSCKSEEEADSDRVILDLLRSMLVLDPAERPFVRHWQVIETHRWLEPNNILRITSREIMNLQASNSYESSLSRRHGNTILTNNALYLLLLNYLPKNE